MTVSRKTVYTIAFATAASLGMLWFTDWPLGVPGEWAWDRIEYEQSINVLLRVFEPVIAGGLLFAIAWFGCKRVADSAVWEKLFWWLALMVAAFSWLWTVQDAAPMQHGLLKSGWVTYYPSSSGYFYLARYEMADVPSFLQTYEKRMSEGDVLHVGTHPPGLFVIHRLLINACNESPTLSNWLVSTQPRSTVEGLDIISENVQATTGPLTNADRAAIWLAALMTQLAVVLAMIPLFGLLRRHFSATTSWKVVVFWPLVPALAIFLPKSDALFPLLGLSFLWLASTGYQDRSYLKCFLAGIVLWVAMMISLAILPVVVLTALLISIHLVADRSRNLIQRGKHLISLASVCLLGFGIPVAVCYWQFQMNLVAVWSWNYRNHAGFYDQNVRTYSKWLFENPVELAFAVGLPIFILTSIALAKHIREFINRRFTKQGALAIACLFVWGLLWLSGKNMGEAARLWIVVQPWLLLSMAACFATDDELTDLNGQEVTANSKNGSPNSAHKQTGDWALLLLIQMIACWGTVVRVTGFDFGRY